MSYGDPRSRVTQRMGSLPPSRITEVKMVTENRPIMGLITAQLILFQKGKQKKNHTHNKPIASKEEECNSSATLGNTRSWAAGQAQAS